MSDTRFGLTPYGALLVLLALPLLAGCGEDDVLNQNAAGVDSTRPRILSAFFGLDDALPPIAALLCFGAAGKDGMPIVLSREIDQSTLDPDDFEIITRSGSVHVPLCTTMRPAMEENEDRTILLIGEFGDAENDPPEQIRITGSLYSEPDGPEDASELNGLQSENITPLEAGPFLVWAEVLPEDEQELGKTGPGGGCPTERTVQVVRATWAGGVTKPSGGEIDDEERLLYRVVLQSAGGETQNVIPFAIADLNDRDNNHDLCVEETGRPIRVEFPAAAVVDPNGDLNPPTSVAVYGN